MDIVFEFIMQRQKEYGPFRRVRVGPFRNVITTETPQDVKCVLSTGGNCHYLIHCDNTVYLSPHGSAVFAKL